VDRSAAKGTAGCDGVRVTVSPMAKRYLGNAEPPIDELLTDPIAALLRRSDRLSLQEVCLCIDDAIARRGKRAGESRRVRGS
jgi:hypothetical protein